MFKIERFPITDHDLGKWIKFIWHFEASDQEVHHKLLPMDSIDILLNLGGEMEYETVHGRNVAPKAHINGLRDQHSFIHQKGDINIWGISFYAFGLYPFISKSVHGIPKGIMDLSVVSEIFCQNLFDALENETTQETMESILEVLASGIQINETLLYRRKIILDFMNTEDISISVFCKERQINQRTFERLVKNMTGYSPVNLRRVRRYKTASNQLLFDKSADLPEIIYDNHFTDQAYFTKECRAFSGVTPRVFQKEKNTVIENTTYI